jgi:hypothetical protein
MRSIAIAAVFAVVLAGCASTKETTKGTGTTSGTVTQTREGLVTAVRGQQVEVYSPAATESRTIWMKRTDETEITRDGNRISWSELQSGTPVRISVKPDIGAERAIRVQVLTGAEADKLRAQIQQNPPSYGGYGGTGDDTGTPEDQQDGMRTAPNEPSSQDPMQPDTGGTGTRGGCEGNEEGCSPGER